MAASILIFGLCVCFSFVLLFFVKSKPHKLSIINFICTYLIIVFGYLLYDIYLYQMLNSFDLNSNGIFSGNEINTEQQKYMNLVIHDTGRNFVIITGLFYALVSSIIFYALLKFKRLLINTGQARNG